MVAMSLKANLVASVQHTVSSKSRSAFLNRDNGSELLQLDEFENASNFLARLDSGDSVLSHFPGKLHAPSRCVYTQLIVHGLHEA